MTKKTQNGQSNGPLAKAYRTVAAWKGFWIVGNLTLAAVIVVVAIFGTQFLLDWGTNHGESLSVPDFVGMTPQQAEFVADQSGVRVEVVDSVFSKTGRGRVREQNPVAGTAVKEGRRIQLVVNAMGVQKVAVPNVVGYSARQALAELNSRGLTLGQYIYVNDMATNNVLKQLYKGREVEPGTMLEAEASVDLVVGLNPHNSGTIIPDVRGKRAFEASRDLNEYYLNVRRCIYDSNVRTYDDSLKAVVYKMAPEPGGYAVGLGTDVKLYLRLEKEEE